MGGRCAYPTIHDKAAALLHSLARNHGLVGENKRLVLASVIAFYGLNGFRLAMSDDEAYTWVEAVARGALAEVDDIARVLKPAAKPRRR